MVYKVWLYTFVEVKMRAESETNILVFKNFERFCDFALDGETNFLNCKNVKLKWRNLKIGDGQQFINNGNLLYSNKVVDHIRQAVGWKSNRGNYFLCKILLGQYIKAKFDNLVQMKVYMSASRQYILCEWIICKHRRYFKLIWHCFETKKHKISISNDLFQSMGRYRPEPDVIVSRDFTKNEVHWKRKFHAQNYCQFLTWLGVQLSLKEWYWVYRPNIRLEHKGRCQS